MTNPEPPPLTISDWKELNRVIVWSIHNQASYDRFEAVEPEDDEAWSAAYRRIELDLGAPPGTPDGVHEVHYDSPGYTGNGNGVIVTNGRFDPRSTADAALAAVCQARGTIPTRLDHVFIEGWRYDQETRRLYVTLGS